MTDNYDQLALSWVRKEINNTLEQAKQGLETYAEDNQDKTQIQFCINCLHQVQGTLQMLGFEGAARLALEMEGLAKRAAEKNDVITEKSFEVLMRSIMQMPGYLERVESGQRDIPVILLPLINELRSVSNLPPCKEEELFTADTAKVAPPKPVESATQLERSQLFQESAKKLRAHFQKGLAGIIRGQGVKESLGRIHKVLLRLEALTEGQPVSRLWWVADGFIFSIVEKNHYKKKEVHQLLSQVDKHIRRLADDGTAALTDEVPESLLSKLLYYVARSQSKNARVQKLKREFKLEDSLVESEAIANQQKQLTRPDSKAMASVLEAVSEELNSVKDQLDLFVRAQNKDASQLKDLTESLNRIADTLTILELPIPRDVIREQHKSIQKSLDTNEMPNDAAIMDIAGALLFVEANLNNFDVESFVNDDEPDVDIAEVQEQKAKETQLADATLTVIKVARKNLQLAKDCMVNYIAASFKTSELEDVPKLVDDVLGAMQIVGFDDAGSVLKTSKLFVEQMLGAANIVPEEKLLDALADIVTSVDYYLEGSEEGNNKAIASILKNAKLSQSVLHEFMESQQGLHDDKVAEPATSQQTLHEVGASEETENEVAAQSANTGEEEASDVNGLTLEPSLEQTATDTDTSSVDSEVLEASSSTDSSSEPSSAGQAGATTNVIPLVNASAGKVIDESLIDDDVLEIFLEEAEEEIEVIGNTLPIWINELTNQDALTTIRRSFHTLKGSGRLVGAVHIGELSWSVENMLNKVIEESVPAETPVITTLNEVLALLPKLVEAFSNKTVLFEEEVSHLSAKADHIAKGLNLADFQFEHDTAEEAVETAATNEENELTNEETDTNVDAIPTLSEEVDSPTEETIDPVLLEIFVNEANVHLNALNQYISEAPAEGTVAVTDELIRALHTLKGSAHMAKVEPIAKLAAPLEKYARIVKGGGSRFESSIFPVLKDVSHFMSHVVDQLKETQALEKHEYDELLAKIQHIVQGEQGGVAEPVDSQQQQMQSIFLTEGLDILQSISEQLSGLVENVESQQAQEDIANELHTFRRGSEMLSMQTPAKFATVLEGLSRLAIQGKENLEEYVRLMDISIENLSQMLSRIASEEDIEEPSALVDEIQSWIEELSRTDAPSDMDQELVELFVEEADELIESATELLVRWKDHLESKELTGELRRIYHTFKGSSRMAGAMNIGDLAYAIENVYNTHVDFGRGLSEIDFKLVNQATEKLIEMVNILRNFRWPQKASEEIQELESHVYPERAAQQDSVAQTSPTDLGSESAISEKSVVANDEAERAEAERAEAERVEAERVEAERVEAERVEAERAEAERAEAERAEAERAEAERAEAERAKEESKRAEIERIEAERRELERLAAERTPQVSEDTIAPSAPIAISGDIQKIDLDEDGLEVLEIYLEEADELLIALDEALHLWSDDRSSKNAIDTLQRTLHTFKGGARLSDLMVLGDLTHEMETYFEKVAAGSLTAGEDEVAFLLKGYDAIESLVNEVKTSQQLTRPTAYLEQLDNLIHGRPFTSDSAVENITSDDVVEMDATAQSETKVDESSAELNVEDKSAESATEIAESPKAEVVSFEKRKQQQEDSRKRASGTGDVVRVNAEQLESLVNLAGETSIFRSRLEQQMSVLRYNLDEMSSTVERLRDQLRNLDIETEAQISYRREISGGTEYEDFDPLEMDRYTRQQELTRGLGESAVDLLNLKETLDSLTSDSETLLLQQGRVNTEMQESLMQTRMTPFESLVPRLRRMIRQISTELGKTVELSISADGEMDRSVLERMIAPLEHMLRNAMDHGIELPSERLKSGKNESGKIAISLYREGSEVFIKIKDDGRGLNLDAIRQKAIERGLISSETQLNSHELQQLILEAGFSTAETVTQISGRGVGMDVVNSEIKQLGGVIEIDSVAGQGSTFTVRLPFTVSVNQALMVQIGEEVYAIPLSNIEGIVRVSPFELEEYYSNQDSKFAYAGIDYSMYYLGQMLEHSPNARLAGVSQPLPVLLLHGADHPTALQVDDLLGSREIVVKSIGSQLSSISGLSGATIQGDGRVVLILDMPALIRRVDAKVEATDAATDMAQEDRVPTVMVVDDSITVRKVTTRLLERNDFDVITAKDGVDAVTVLAENIPDVMLLDIEMPRMDGFELATIIKHDERLKHIPIIMITSRTGEKHRERAESIGVNEYMGKPYNEVDLLETIDGLLSKNS